MDATFDSMYYHYGDKIAGVDETGVSDIAGPLVAACVVLPKIQPHKDDLKIFEVNDSKQIPEKYRRQHAETILQSAIAIGIGEVQPAEIDYLGKHVSTSLAMLRAVASCKTTDRGKLLRPDFILVDGERPIQTMIQQSTIKHADQKSLCVAAASIIAKVYRDEIMIKLHERYPYYDWINNKGYPCESHFKGIDSHGVEIGIHRIKYWPFRNGPGFHEDAEKWRTRRYLWRQITERRLSQDLPIGTDPCNIKNLLPKP